MRIRSPRHPVAALVALVLAFGLVGSAGVAAQGLPSTPPPDLSGTIAQGTCDAPGQATYEVGDFIRLQESEIVGSQELVFTLRTQRNVDSSLEALFGATPYVFLVTDNTDPGGAPVACGALGGVNVNGQITIALTTPDQLMASRDLIVGVAIFGATTPEGPTTQPAAQPGQLPVQAYLSEAALQPVEVPSAPPAIAPASPTAAPSTPVPTMAPTEAPTMAPTQAPTQAPTMPPTAPPTMPPTAPPTMPPTAPPTMPPTAPPTMPPTEASTA